MKRKILIEEFDTMEEALEGCKEQDNYKNRHWDFVSCKKYGTVLVYETLED